MYRGIVSTAKQTVKTFFKFQDFRTRQAEVEPGLNSAEAVRLLFKLNYFKFKIYIRSLFQIGGLFELVAILDWRPSWIGVHLGLAPILDWRPSWIGAHLGLELKFQIWLRFHE